MAVIQFVGTVLGNRVPVRMQLYPTCRLVLIWVQVDVLFGATAAGCVVLTTFPSIGAILFGFSFGALFRYVVQ